MEYVEGQTLKEILAQGPIPLVEALRVAVEVVEALAKAHHRGIVHRDIKPSNLMLTPDGHVKVMDFGLAKRVVSTGAAGDTQRTVTGLTANHVVLGTPAYMSPEQVRGKTLDARSDIFSFGVMLYEMVCGVHPFLKETAVDTSIAIINETPSQMARYVVGCPELFQHTVQKMLAKEPNQRYQSIREVLTNLGELKEATRLTKSPLDGDATAPGADSDFGALGTSSELAVQQKQQDTAALAVLPFVNRSSDAENEYFSDGITEDIIANLSKLGQLRVISRTSMMLYKGSDKGLAEIARELNVDSILEGSVRRSGGRIRIVTSLVDAASDNQIWSDTYDRKFEDIFSVQSEVSQKIAKALRTTLTPSQELGLRREEREDPKAYNSYLKGRYFSNKLSPDGIQKGIGHFMDALDIDPTFARSYAGISTSYANAGHFGFLPPDDAFPRAKEAAKRSLDIDERLPEAHTSMGVVLLFYDLDWVGAEKHLKTAIELNPNYAEAYQFYSLFLSTVGRLDCAVKAAEQALEQDPLSLFAGVNLAWILSLCCRFDDSIQLVTKVLDMNPSFLPANGVLAVAYAGKKMFTEAISLLEVGSWSKAHLGEMHALAGNHDAARKILQELLNPEQQEHYSPLEIGQIFFFMGELDQAAVWFEKAYREHDNKVIFLNEHMKFYRKNFSDLLSGTSHQKIDDLIRRMGLEP